MEWTTGHGGLIALVAAIAAISAVTVLMRVLAERGVERLALRQVAVIVAASVALVLAAGAAGLAVMHDGGIKPAASKLQAPKP
jgi:hypothetical protein